MENASKALLIAGAILLAILIISLGLMAYNQAKNTVGSSNLSKQEIEAFNSQWETYQGTNKTSSEVRSLYSAVIAHNASETKLGTNRTITLKLGNGTAAAPTSVPNTTEVPNSSNYTISITYATSGNNNGLVQSLTID